MADETGARPGSCSMGFIVLHQLTYLSRPVKLH